ncbi:nuclear transport factor 2 family protein [Fulvivirgaceae bacterium BMA12]|uniref:Nuclear transport factor 2 family protein n=1 Tax=Agaribacillus aureus TaxID=3051825 RepID=A0ABT8L0M0_9BACT|nr:nuclear transport factor 2 family protein [Fulvivirgaceae bacterium BMA12]
MPDHNHLIASFYKAFQRRDYQSMAACYHEQLTFRDPAFATLDYKQATAMWHMLCERGKDLELTFSQVESDENQGSCRWEAKYTFSATGHKVHNIINAKFRFEAGKIVQHIDEFNFWRWSRQALGLPGQVLGWSPVLKNKVQKTALASLEKFITQHTAYQ